AATPPTIGTPTLNTEILILDEALQPVADGEPGEMYIGGAGVARGYLNRPEMTTDRFIAHPFSATSGARLYKTGDRARRLPDGQIAFLGRNDDQLKIRGYRIEPGEIAQAIESYDGVVSSLVVAHTETAGEKRLIAYLVCPPDVTVSERGLREHLLDRLPEYMVPVAYVALPSF